MSEDKTLTGDDGEFHEPVMGNSECGGLAFMWEWIKSQPPLPPARPKPPQDFIKRYTEGWARPLDDATWRQMYEFACEEWEGQLLNQQRSVKSKLHEGNHVKQLFGASSNFYSGTCHGKAVPGASAMVREFAVEAETTRSYVVERGKKVNRKTMMLNMGNFVVPMFDSVEAATASLRG